MKKALFARVFLVVTSLFCLAVPHSAAQDAPLRASWTCLPQETVGFVRFPSLNGFFAALRKQTKLGAVAFGEERMNKGVALLRESMGSKWEEMTEDLAKYGFKFEDWRELGAGECGYAVTQFQRAGESPAFIGIGWFEPGGDLAERVVKGVLKGFEESAKDIDGPQRIDTEIHGRTVTRLSSDVSTQIMPDAPPIPPDFSELSPDQQRAWFEEVRKRQRENTRDAAVDRFHVLFTRIGTRVLLAHNYPVPKGSVRDQLVAAPETRIDLDAVSNLPLVTDVFARFLAGHAAAGADQAGVRALVAAPGMAALPAGVPFLEFYFNPKPLVDLLEAEGPDAQRASRIIGLRQLGPFGLRMTLDKSIARFGMLLSVPAPRTGIMSLMDQEPLPPEPPAWVEESVVGYGHFACDLGKTYATIKDAVISELGAGVAAGFSSVEAQVMQFMQTDLASALSALGRRHSFVQCGVAKKIALGGDLEEVNIDEFMGAFSCVWELKDEEVLKRVFKALEPFAQRFPEYYTPAEEQGFTGWRMKDSFEACLFLGRGFLVLSFGKGSAEKTLASVRTPPAGPAAMREGAALSRAKSVLGLQPGLFFAVSNAGQYVRDQYALMTSALEQLLNMAGNGSMDESFHQRVLALLPTAEEITGTVGVSVANAYANPHGFMLESAYELPPP